ncbi:hypothetical protein [Propylenella binzhouense]|uniref:Uncharacterized protein n=1 Tax=Propylenella binzhouense TaxID=2555902 RepID=A0A964WUK6_9HYPH|nr:hypothetical protein [Propylenella binzhouense]MYZ49129.1 hypothetical protein [Propylenella binzhouense]
MSVTRSDLTPWILTALNDLGGEAKIVTIAKHIWDKHENDLRSAGDLFYTWQYDMRWAAMKLRQSGKLAASDDTERGRWAIKK